MFMGIGVLKHEFRWTHYFFSIAIKPNFHAKILRLKCIMDNLLIKEIMINDHC